MHTPRSRQKVYVNNSMKNIYDYLGLTLMCPCFIIMGALEKKPSKKSYNRSAKMQCTALVLVTECDAEEVGIDRNFEIHSS